MTDVKARLVSRIAERDNGCHEWTGYVARNGYGQIGIGNRKIGNTHRVAYEQFVGPITDGMWVLHHCDNRRCCNAAHLYLGTAADNVRDMHARNRARKAQGIDASHGRLTGEQVAEIRRRHVPGQKHKPGTGNTAVLAAEFGITKQYVWQLTRGIWRKHA